MKYLIAIASRAALLLAARRPAPVAHLQSPGRREEARRCGAEVVHDQMREGRQPACNKSAAEKKLAGAAKTSHVKKCVTDAVGS